MANFKVNIYPVIYWGLAYALIAGFVLFVLFLLSKYITVIWFPVFLAGLIWGGYRNYKKQKEVSGNQSNEPAVAQSPLEEAKEAARDIFSAARDMVADQLEEEEGKVVAQEVSEEAPVSPEQEIIEEPAPPPVATNEVESKKPEVPETPRTPV
jgi:hypothetical protein